MMKYVCMSVCMHACIYIRFHVCRIKTMYVCMNVCTVLVSDYVYHHIYAYYT